MTTFVVPLDGSTFAERAVRHACSMAARTDGASVMLLRSSSDDDSDAWARLAELAELYADVADVEVTVVASDDAAATIATIVNELPDGVLCMATHGRGGVRSTVLGNVTRRVVCRSIRPIVLIGPRCASAILPRERGRMIVCTDGSPFADTVVGVAGDLCDRLGLEPWFVEVVVPDEDPESARRIPNRMVAAAEANLDRLVAGFGRPARTAVLHGNPSRAISQYAEQLPAVMIAMATHGRTGLVQLAMGSVATDVVRHAPCPVVISRPPQAVQACLDG